MQMRPILFFVSAALAVSVPLVSMSARADDAHAQITAISRDDLPADPPAMNEVVHHMKYAMLGQSVLEAGVSMLAGDKFLSTTGFGASYSHYIAETLAIGGGLATYSSTATDEALALSDRGVAPLSHNPSSMVRGFALWEPIYGKLLFGEHIQHFRLGFEGGLHAAKETVVTGASSVPSRTVMGPDLGARLWIPVSDRWSVSLRGQVLLEGGVEPSEDSRKLWLSSLSMGWRL